MTAVPLHPGISGSATERVACVHCQLPVPAGLIDPASTDQFCCNGCRAVHEMINGCGLGRYYALRDKAPEQQATPGTGNYEEFDAASFSDAFCLQRDDGLTQTELILEGLHCAACVWLLERLGRVVAGVVESRVQLGRSSIRIVYDADVTSLSSIARALDSLGYRPHPATDGAARDARANEQRQALVRIGVAGALAGNLMLIAIALYSSAFSGMADGHRTLFHLASMALAATSLAWPGAGFFKSAIASVRTRTPHLDLPIAIGLTLGFSASAINTVRGAGDVYFDSVGMLVFLLLVGRWLQVRAQQRATSAVSLLYCLTPAHARVTRDGRELRVPIDALRVGDAVVVDSEESIPIDGVVTSGCSLINSALLTGESRPIAVEPGDRVCAGFVNLGSRLTIATELCGADTRVGRLMSLIEELSMARTPAIGAANRIAGWFVAVVMLLAIATFAFWSLNGSGSAIEHTVALLIVTCPCALALATPLSITVAIGRAARRGIMIKGGSVIERLARCGTLVLDKTGTLTLGTLRLKPLCGEDSAWAMAAAVEQHVAHPIARVISRSIDPGDRVAREVNQTTGAGAIGMVGAHRVCVGSPAFVATQARIPDAMTQLTRATLEEGDSVILVAVDGIATAAGAIGDSIRPEAKATLDGLRRDGWEIQVASGDDQRIVDRVADELGLALESCTGNLSPEDKVDLVRQLKRTLGEAHPVVMIGDGVNDAAALAAADVGVAVSGGAEASLTAADVFLSAQGISPLRELLRGVARAASTIRICVAVSLSYNFVVAGFAMSGMISPLASAVIMPISSLSVLALAAGRRSFTVARREATS